MKEHIVELTALQCNGKARINKLNDAIEICTTHSPTSSGSTKHGNNVWRHHVLLPDKYRLPFRLDVTVKLDFPSFWLLIGSGHIRFATLDFMWVQDIAFPLDKPAAGDAMYSNKLPLNEFVDISIVYNYDEMQICVGGKERFYSNKQAYMKKKNRDQLSKINGEGFPVGLAVSKGSKLTIKNITVTEFDDNIPVARNELGEVRLQSFEKELPKINYENVLLKAPSEFKDEIIKTDAFLKALRPLKFRRTVNKYEHGAKITYVAPDYGVSYAIVISNTKCSHDFGWYIVYNGPPETWHRKADYMEELLAEIAKTDRLLAGRIFYALDDCRTCYTHSLCKTLYSFDGEKRLTCHGRVHLRICCEDFNDARAFFLHLNKLIERKIANGEPPPEKINLAGTKLFYE